jgi:hypothetical protein
MNELIDVAVIEKCLDSLENFEPTKSTQSLQSLNSSENSLTFLQFRQLYELVKERLKSPIDFRVLARTSRSGTLSAQSQENVYWQTPEASVVLDGLPCTEPPLLHRGVDWSSSLVTDSMIIDESGSIPVGSAVDVARKKKQSAVAAN